MVCEFRCLMYTTFTVVPILDTKQVMQAGITAEFFTPMNHLQIRSGKPVSKGWVYQARSHASTHTHKYTYCTCTAGFI